MHILPHVYTYAHRIRYYVWWCSLLLTLLAKSEELREKWTWSRELHPPPPSQYTRKDCLMYGNVAWTLICLHLDGGGRRRLRGKQGSKQGLWAYCTAACAALLLLHSSSVFVQSAAAPSDPRISARPLSMEQSVRFLLSNKTKRWPLGPDLFPIIKDIGSFWRVLL